MNEYFGTEADLIQLVQECHKRDVWVMLDVVFNHVGPVGSEKPRELFDCLSLRYF